MYLARTQPLHEVRRAAEHVRRHPSLLGCLEFTGTPHSVPPLAARRRPVQRRRALLPCRPR